VPSPAPTVSFEPTAAPTPAPTPDYVVVTAPDASTLAAPGAPLAVRWVNYAAFRNEVPRHRVVRTSPLDHCE
jgi:hypothetical protein